MPSGEVRRYLHSLWRCERHTHSPGNLVQALIACGALSKAGRILQLKTQLVYTYVHELAISNDGLFILKPYALATILLAMTMAAQPMRPSS